MAAQIKDSGLLFAKEVYYQLLRASDNTDDKRILSFIVNIYLVITKARTAYRFTVVEPIMPTIEVLVRLAKDIVPQLVIINWTKEPIFTLQAHMRKLSDLACESDTLADLQGRMLGHRYIGPISRSRYEIIYTCSACELYRYPVPVTEYTEDIEAAIEEDIALFTRALAELEITHVECSVYKIN